MSIFKVIILKERTFIQSILVVIALIFSSINVVDSQTLPTVVAHRGCWFEGIVPENSLGGVAMAARLGYPAIELDVHYSADSTLVIMHDGTLNRTMRLAEDYAPIEGEAYWSKMKGEEIYRDYVLASDVPAYRQPMPTLKEMLCACRDFNVMPMLHTNVWEAFVMAYDILGDDWICFGCILEMARRVRAMSDCLILLDLGHPTADEAIAILSSVGGHCGLSTMKADLLTAEFCQALRNRGFEVQSSIFPCPKELAAVTNGVSYLLSDFCIPFVKRKPCHRRVSHDNGMLPGDSIIHTFHQNPEYGGLLVSLTFQGKIELELNRSKRYVIESERLVTRTVSLRFCALPAKERPMVSVKALGPAAVSRFQTYLYSY